MPLLPDNVKVITFLHILYFFFGFYFDIWEIACTFVELIYRSSNYRLHLQGVGYGSDLWKWNLINYPGNDRVKRDAAVIAKWYPIRGSPALFSSTGF